jgi:hypothetical protein
MTTTKPAIKWYKSIPNLNHLILECAGEESRLRKEGLFKQPFDYRWTYLLCSKVEQEFLTSCQRSNDPIVQKILGKAKNVLFSRAGKLRRPMEDLQVGYHVLDCMAIGVEIRVSVEDRPYQLFYSPFYKEWNLEGGSGKWCKGDAQIAGEMFMSDTLP